MEGIRETYANIELTEQEAEEALRLARKAKYHRIEFEAYTRKVNAVGIKVTHTAEQLANIVGQRFVERSKKPYIIDEHNEEIFNLLCYYFSGDQRFEESGEYSLKKGILLFGDVGVGKTELMRLFCQNHYASFGVFSCREIIDEYIENGSCENVERFYKARKATSGDPYKHEFLGCCFDDLGTETIPAQHYGSKKNLMAEVIMNRYDNNVPFNLTHITTNLDVLTINTTYGTRCIDRMAQMFNQINFPVNSKSRR